MKLILTTANARYTHCAFGLRCLAAALKTRGLNPVLREFTINQSAYEIAEALLEEGPDVIGFGVYIWNVEIIGQIAHILRSVSPRTVIIAGGPEMLGTNTDTVLFTTADYVITGEAEEALADLISQIAAGTRPEKKHIVATPPPLDRLPSPYNLYTDEDIRNRIVYVESSRGCPYRCAFCLSSRDKTIRYVPLPQFFADMEMLLGKGVRLFKFTDRTFNLDDARVVEILNFFSDRMADTLQLHFEIMPDRLSKPVREMMATFPPGALHLELGVQSVNAETQQRIGRHQDIGRTLETIAYLRDHTGALLHADLIIGLPGDREEDVAEGFNTLVQAGVQELQVGLLKRLNGTPMTEDTGAELVFDRRPPYEVLQTPLISFTAIQRLKRFARFFDLYHNRGNFPESLPLLWAGDASPYSVFSDFAAYLWDKEKRAHGIALARLAEHLFRYCCEKQGRVTATIAQHIEKDFRRLAGRRDRLDFLP